MEIDISGLGILYVIVIIYYILTVNISSDISYRTADNLAVLPENPSDIVERFASGMKLQLNDYIRVVPVPKNDDIQDASHDTEEFKHPFPSPCSIRYILTCYLDIMVLSIG
jgi:sulfite reductase alpha subunit-like flavoprotein